MSERCHLDCQNIEFDVGIKRGPRWIFFHLCQNMKMSWIFFVLTFSKSAKRRPSQKAFVCTQKNDPTTGSLHFDCLYSCQSKLQDLFFKNFCFVYNSEKKTQNSIIRKLDFYKTASINIVSQSLLSHKTTKKLEQVLPNTNLL